MGICYALMDACKTVATIWYIAYEVFSISVSYVKRGNDFVEALGTHINKDISVG